MEAGCDEAGRGCLAGPVCAAAVVFKPEFDGTVLAELNDSKQLTEKMRYALRPLIEQHALSWAVAFVSHTEIDEINILNASFLAMHRALDKLTARPENIVVDGNRFKKYQSIPHHCIVKGDGKYLSIAAASVLAKTYRDDLMDELHQQFPEYGWNKNKAYATQQHRDAIAKHGQCEYHRKSFRLLPEQLTMAF
jgi:ribonuclease HII